MHINWQKTLLITLDVALAIYLGFAFTKFNKPDEKGMLCTKVNINIEDYYIDDHYQVMPNTNYTSDIIIATGNINKWFAQKYISLVSKTLMKNNLWRNQIEQINVLPDRGIELVPRVGNHIIYIGNLPESNIISKREQDVEDFINRKMDRLEKFYKYGLSQAGWNKYSYINIEFDNQIICTKHHKS